MTMNEQPRTRARAVLTRTHDAKRWAAAVAGAGAAVTLLAIVVFVWTPWGQRVDDLMLRSVIVNEHGPGFTVDRALVIVNEAALAVVIGGCILLAVIRRRFDLGVGALLVGLGPVATSLLLRYQLVPRPDFGFGALGMDNTSPSGHAAVAAGLGLAMVMATPMRWRFWATVIGSLWTGWVAMGLVVSHNHRPGDMLASLGVAALWAGIAVGVASRVARTHAVQSSLSAYREAASAGTGLGALSARAAARADAPSSHRALRVDAAPYGLTLLFLAGVAAEALIAVLFVSWGVEVGRSFSGFLLGLTALAVIGLLVALLIGGTSRAVEKYLG